MATSHWQDATIRNLEIIGEAVKRLSDDFKARNTNIPWRNVAGLRDVLIHDYMGVDLDNVWNVAQLNLPNATISGLNPFTLSDFGLSARCPTLKS